MQVNILGTKRLETERLILRRFTIDDAEQIYNNWATEKEVCKYLRWNPHKNIEETKNIINSWIKDYDNNNYIWGVELKDSHELIGSISAINVDNESLNVEIGYCYGTKYWNKGYATEALKRVIDYFLNDCNYYLVACDHMSDNPASGKVMEKAGMKKEAVLRKRKINEETNKLNDLIVYSITKDDIL